MRERSGTAERGTITALYTVLVDGDDLIEPIADAVRSILDGHVVLSRHLAHAGHYPAIDVLASVSRLVGEVTMPAVRRAGDEVRRLMAAYRDKEDLIATGAYQPGTDPLTDAVIAARTPLEEFLRQPVDEPTTVAEAERRLLELAAYAQLSTIPDPGALVPVPAEAVPAATPLPAAIPPLDRPGLGVQLGRVPRASRGRTAASRGSPDRAREERRPKRKRSRWMLTKPRYARHSERAPPAGPPPRARLAGSCALPLNAAVLRRNARGTRRSGRVASSL